ncbi:MAG: YfhO family protein [Deltaproteobacteria bacterium]|nr:YfhO family protein [Deltaproteobacteria bacterium]
MYYFYPVKRFVYDYFLTNGALPFWNPYLFSGTPFIADIQAAMFYPLGFLYYVIPTETAYLYTTVLHCIVGAIFMYLFMRSLRASKWGAFLSGFIFIFNGYFMAHIYAGHLSFVQTYVWIPLIFLFLVRLARSKCFRYAVSAGLILGIQILGGFPQLVFYTMLAAILFLIYSCCTGIKTQGAQYLFKMAAAALMFVLIGLSLAAVQLLPTYEFSTLSTRAGGIPYDFATMDSLPPVNLLTFLVPLLFGTPVDGSFWINDSTWEFWEYCGYAGIGALAICVAAMKKLVSDRLGLFFMILIATALFLALGKYNPAYPAIYLLPGFKNFRIPAQIIFLYMFSIAVLAGKGLDLLKGAKALSMRSKRMLFFVLLLFLPLIIWSYGFTDHFSHFLSQHIQFAGYTVGRIFPIASVISRAFFFSYGILFAVLVFLYLHDKERISYSMLTAALIFISIVDLGSFSSPMIQSTDIKPLLEKGKWLHRLTQNPILSRAAISGRCFIENAGLWYGFQDIQGYDPLILKRYMEYINRSQSLPPDRKVVNLHYISNFNHKFIRMLNLKYVVDCKTSRIGEVNAFIPRCTLVHKMETKNRAEILNFMLQKEFDPLNLVIFEETDAPRNFFPGGKGNSPRETCKITRYQNNEIRLIANLDAPGFLVMSEINYPGWQVYVDGKRKKIFTGNYLFRTVPLLKGHHEIHFIFKPRSFKIGAFISVAALFGAMVLILFPFRKRKNNNV